MSDNQVRILAFIFWPLIVCVFAAVMFVGLVVLTVAWPFVPFANITRKQ